MLASLPAPMARRYHLGCGDKRLPEYVNVDVRETDAADVVMDLNEPSLEAATCCFSNAFFEHLRRDARVPHLRAVLASLDPEEGFACYIGLPDFESVARLYLDRGPGVVGPVFDLYEAYRYTHGDPEGVDGWYFEQLHKSLFDSEELQRVLSEAGFPSYVTFTYAFPGEPAALGLGFYASASSRPTEELEAAAQEFLAGFGEYVQPGTVRFTGGKARSPILARASSSRSRRLVHRVAHAASVRLARL
jgi:hypothetical protein